MAGSFACNPPPVDPLRTRARAAFTLIELSIVLVIIGLLVGAIVAGKEMIHASQLRSIGSTAIDIKTRIVMFRDRFGELPGDTNKAFAFWGTECAANANLCNGNPNNLIQSTQYRENHGFGEAEEDQCVFRHLALANLWQGNTSAAACGSTSVNGPNIASYPDIVPRAPRNLYFHVSAWDLFQAHNGNAVNVVVPHDGNSRMMGGGLSPLDAQSIDNKFDDGQPVSGWVFVSHRSATPGCLSTAGAYTTAASTITWYSNLSYPELVCQMHFWIN